MVDWMVGHLSLVFSQFYMAVVGWLVHHHHSKALVPFTFECIVQHTEDDRCEIIQFSSTPYGSSYRICQRVRLNIIFKTFILRIDQQRNGQSSINVKQYRNLHVFWVFKHFTNFCRIFFLQKEFRFQTTDTHASMHTNWWMCGSFLKIPISLLWNKCIYSPEHFG